MMADKRGSYPVFGSIAPLRQAVEAIDLIGLMDIRRGQESMKAYEPSKRDNIRYLAYDVARYFGHPDPGDIAGKVETLAEFTPLSGQALAGEDMGKAYNAGDWAGVGLATLGMIPGYKVGGKAIRKATDDMLSKITGQVISELPMDQSSRMARAKEMGFRTNMPVYHGSADRFTGFDRAQAGRTTGTELGRSAAAWVSPDPEVASEFARLAEKAHRAEGLSASQQVYPLYHRTQNPVTAELDGDETHLEVAGTLKDLFDDGHDAVMIKNFSTPQGKKKIIAIRDPEQLRSIFAKFDPKNINSSDLVASLAALGIMANEIDRHETQGEDER